MSESSKHPSRDAVLEAFAVELETGHSTLERYLRLYPEYAAELIDLSQELARGALDDGVPLSEADQSLIDAAWKEYSAAVPAMAADPFAKLTPNDWRNVAKYLDVPRQVITALRERRVRLSSIPRRFLSRFAEAISCSASQLELVLGGGALAEGRSYKADDKPTSGEQVSLEQVLIDAGVSAEKRSRLLKEVD